MWDLLLHRFNPSQNPPDAREFIKAVNIVEEGYQITRLVVKECALDGTFLAMKDIRLEYDSSGRLTKETVTTYADEVMTIPIEAQEIAVDEYNALGDSVKLGESIALGENDKVTMLETTGCKADNTYVKTDFYLTDGKLTSEKIYIYSDAEMKNIISLCEVVCDTPQPVRLPRSAQVNPSHNPHAAVRKTDPEAMEFDQRLAIQANPVNSIPEGVKMTGSMASKNEQYKISKP
jgi:hypothetical protein